MLRFQSVTHRKKLLFSEFILGFVLLTLLLPVGLQGQNSSIPNPDDVIGFEIGSDFHLATYEQSIEYFKKLDAASDLVEMRETGKTSEGRT